MGEVMTAEQRAAARETCEGCDWYAFSESDCKIPLTYYHRCYVNPEPLVRRQGTEREGGRPAPPKCSRHTADAADEQARADGARIASLEGAIGEMCGQCDRWVHCGDTFAGAVIGIGCPLYPYRPEQKEE